MANESMFGVLGQATELRQRIIFTLGALIIYRLGTYIPVPGINAVALAEIVENANSGVLGMFNMFSGGALGRMTIFALTILPYISASIIMQLMTSISPQMSQLKKEGESGRKTINQYTRYLTVLLATVQAYVFAIHFEGEKVWNIYENIEESPINHPLFRINPEQRIKRAGKLIEQVTLKPGDLLYIPRGQYHDALASKNGAIHVAFGLTYFKPIDLIANIWEKFILNQFMRNDIGPNLDKESQKSILNKLSREIVDIINTDETLDILDTQIKNWPYKIKEYSIKNLVLEGVTYDVSSSVKFIKRGDQSFLISGKNEVTIPEQYKKVTEFILNRELVTEKLLLTEFKNVPENIVYECLENLKNMKVLN